MELPLAIFSFHALVHCSIRHIQIILGLAIIRISDHFLLNVSFLGEFFIARKTKKHIAISGLSTEAKLQAMALVTEVT